MACADFFLSPLSPLSARSALVRPFTLVDALANLSSMLDDAVNIVDSTFSVALAVRVTVRRDSDLLNGLDGDRLHVGCRRLPTWGCTSRHFRSVFED